MNYMSWLLFICFIVSLPIFSADIGSDTSVVRFDIQQIVEDGDRIAGFAALDAGFALGGRAVEATFDSFFPVSGSLDLSFGTLNLNQDLMAHNVTSISHWGNINGNGHRIDLPQSVQCLPQRSIADLCTLTFTFGDVETAAVAGVDFSFDNLYLAEVEDDELSVDEVINENFLENKASVSVGKTIFGIDWHPSKDFIVVGTASGAGDELFTYSFDRVGETLTLLHSIGGVGLNSVNEVAWHPDGGHVAAASDASANELIVYEVDSAGNFGASTSIDFTPDANTVAWNSDGSFLAVGTDVDGGGDELRVYSFVKSPLGLTLNASFEVGATINTVRWNRTATANGEIVIGTETGTNRLQLCRHNSGGGSLTLLHSAVGTAVNAVGWHPIVQCVAAALDNNSEGTAGEFRAYKFENDALSQGDDQEIGDTVLSLAWSPNGRMLMTGSQGLDAADPYVRLYRFDANFVTDSFVTFDQVYLIMQSNAVFDLTAIKFTGECLIEGEGNILSFSPTFSLIIGSNSSLILKDITLAGINSDKLRLTDSTSTVSFQSTTMVLDDDFIFSEGHFELLGDFRVTGPHSFIYQSNEVSKILSRFPTVETVGTCLSSYIGSLCLDRGVTFSYDSSISNTLIMFEDSLAEMVLNSATLHATEVGLQLTTGHLTVHGESYLSSEGTNGITIGDSDASSDFGCDLYGAELHVLQGVLNYKNVQNASWLMNSEYSVVQMMADTTLKLFENIDLGRGKLVLKDNVTLARATGKKAISRTNIKGNVHVETL